MTSSAGKRKRISEFDPVELLEARARQLRELLDGIETHGDGEHESTLRSIARLSVALTSVCAELRQNQRHLIREVARIPLDQILGYLKTLPMQQLVEIAKELTNADADEGLL